jgi:putative endonuclease
LRCADGSYYVGTIRKSLEERVGEHNAGLHGGYTAARRPVTLVFAEPFDTVADAIAAERRLKGWSRAKKEAAINGEWNRLPNWRSAGNRDLILSLRTEVGQARLQCASLKQSWTSF